MVQNPEVMRKNISAIKELILQLKLIGSVALNQLVVLDIQEQSDTASLALHYVIWGKCYLMEGSLIKARRYYRNCDKTLHKLLPESPNSEYKNDMASYILYELSTFYRQMYDFDTASEHLNLARELADADIIVRLIQQMQDSLEIRQNLLTAPLDKLNQHIAYFKENSIHRLWLNSMNLRFSINVQRGNYDAALDDYFDAMSLKSKVNNETIFSRFEIGMGYLLQQQKEYPKAIKLYSDIYKSSISWYIKSHCLQNLSSISEIYHNYDKAVYYSAESIRICEQHGVISNIPQDCYVLGQIYEKKLGDLHIARRYYKKGYDIAIKMQSEGIHLSGFNLISADYYQTFVNCYFAMENDEGEPGFDLYFGFTKNKTWKEIKAIFQHSLLIHQRQRLNDIYELISLLELKLNTLGAIQRRLQKMGFTIPDKRSLYGKKAVIEGEISLNKYITRLNNCNWLDANRIFERDFLLYFMDKHQGNLSVIRAKLDVTYVTLQNMLKDTRSGLSGTPHDTSDNKLS